MSLDKCRKCPFYMVHFKNEVLCNYLYEVNGRLINRGRCVNTCPMD